jgi:hypothetical protein
LIVFTDEATKQFWSYGLHKRTADAVLTCFLHQLYLKELPLEAKIKYFYSDGGGELITERVEMFLCSKGTREFSNTPTDTPELNSQCQHVNFEHLEKWLWQCHQDLDYPRSGWQRLTKLLDMYCDGSRLTQPKAI